MEIPPAVASELALLSWALADLSDDFGRRLKACSESVTRAVPSYLGLTLHLREDPPVHLTSMIAADDTSVPVGTSLLVPRHRADPAQAPPTADHVTLVLYAARPGAFVDLAADLALLTGNDLGDVVLDQHLTPPPDTTQALERESTVNQAIGVLIDRGLTPEQAVVHLDTRATLDHSDRWTASTQLLDGDLPGQDPLGPVRDDT